MKTRKKILEEKARLVKVMEHTKEPIFINWLKAKIEALNWVLNLES